MSTASTLRSATLAAAGLVVSMLPATAQDAVQDAAIKVDGSSTVYPITQEAVRRTGAQVDNRFSGTSDGFRRFCAGETQINNASRPINADEIEACAATGIAYVELPIAFDALAVVVHPGNN
ncbi:MAG: substrate-binding domain-containing protein, partial [Roseinatronobacter sp.]